MLNHEGTLHLWKYTRLIVKKKLYVKLRVFIKVIKNKYNFNILSTNIDDQ